MADNSGFNIPSFQPETSSSDNSLTAQMKQFQNLLGSTGTQATNTGQKQVQSGVTAAAPALDFLTKLVKGDQADLQSTLGSQNQAIDEQFAQVRKMVSGQPRGGGKAGVLAEEGFKASEAKQKMAGEARTSAAGQLGNLSTQLAGIGLGESELGLKATEAGALSELTRRGQDMGPGSFAAQFSNIAQALQALI